MRDYLRNDNAILAFALLAIIMPFYSSFPYLDDMVRLTYNYTGLIVQGRYLTEWFYTAMQGMQFTTFPDIYYFNLAFVVFLTLSLKHYVLDRNEHLKYNGMMLIICIFSSPFILENLSYHIDSIGMFSSLILSIASACINNSRFVTRAISSAVILFIATCFYQFSLNVYICTVAIISLAMTKSHDDKSLLKFTFSKIISLLVAFIIYMSIMQIYATDTYVDSHATLMTLEEMNNGVLFNNITNINKIIKSAFTPYYSLFFILLISVALIGLIHQLIINIRNKRYLSVACLLAAPIVTLSMVYMPAALFSRPIIQPRILIAYGFFVFVLFSMSISIVSFKRIAFICVVALFTVNVMTASAFSKSQSFVIYSTKAVMDKIYTSTPESMKDSNGEVKVILTNLYNHGMEFERNSKYFPVLNYLVRDPQKSPFLLNGLNRYFRTGIKVIRGKYVGGCNPIGVASPWIYLSTCDDETINVTFKNYY